MSATIAYAVSRFPRITETFILREMIELQRRGWPIDLYSIIHESGEVAHTEARAFEERAHFMRDTKSELIPANLSLMGRSPGLYAHLLARTVAGNVRSPGFLARALAIYPGAVAFAARMRRRGVAHVHAHFGTHAALLAMIAAEANGVGFSFTVHAGDLYVDTTMLAEKVRGARFVATISEFNRGLLVDLAGADVASKIHVVRCGVHVDEYRFVPRAIGAGPLRLLAIGSLRDYKGHEYLIRACALLRAAAPELEFDCTIAGGGPLRDRLERLISALDLRGVVTLLGAQDQHAVLKLTRRANLVLMPSIIAPNRLMEGIPVALMEALAVGLPVIASNISGIPELIRHGETGLLVPPESPTAIRDAILACYQEPEAAAARAERGRQLIEHEYSLVENVGRLDRLFQGVISAPVAVTS